MLPAGFSTGISSILLLLSILLFIGETNKTSAFCSRLSLSDDSQRTKAVTIGAQRGGHGVSGTALLRSSSDHDESSYLVNGPYQTRLSNVRRNLILKSSSLLWLLLVVTPRASVADADDNPANKNDDEERSALTASLYNPDGSLKANVASEATFRTVSFRLGTTGDQVLEAMDGQPIASSISTTDTNYHQGNEVIVTYQLPDKWTDQPPYMENGQSVCRRISIYKTNNNHGANLDQATATTTTNIGIPKALETYRVGLNDRADLMSGGIRDGYYYDFDFAMAPPLCEERSKDNLGLGFCPYDEIFLLSARRMGEQVYVFCIEATKEQWKRANADIRRVRRSFHIEVPSSDLVSSSSS